MISLPTILLVDDHQIFRSSLKSLINNEEIGIVVGEASNGNEFLEILDKSQPDLVLMDIDMPVMDGSVATIRAIEKYPNLKVMALSMFGDEHYYYKMVKSGVKGFLLKTCDINELEYAIKEVAAGENYFSNELLRSIITNFESKTQKRGPEIANLTDREIDVIKLICNGLTNDEIADKLHISSKTVKGHRASLLAKTESRNTPSMVIFAIKHKLIEI